MGAKGITVATLILMAMMITVNSDDPPAPSQDHFDQKGQIYQCYDNCCMDCFHDKQVNHECFLNCHHKCLGGLFTAHTVQYCSMGCSMIRCSTLAKDASKKEECEKGCSKYCNGKVH